MDHGERLDTDGATPSPNIWNDADTYETENLAVDRGGLIEEAMVEVVGGQEWGRILDVGCGSGFHLPRWAEHGSVIGVEPHPPLVERARARVDALPLPVAQRIEVRAGTAQELPVEDASVDVAHARWAYFFGPGCEPGLAELDRVMAPGGVAFVIDNDATTSTFGSWFRRAFPSYDALAIERFWRRHGWTRIPLQISWQMDSRAEFEAVVRIEFTPDLAETILSEHPGTSVDYAINLWWRRHSPPKQ